MRQQLLQKINQLPHFPFDALCLEVFRFQAACNPVYAKYLGLLGIDPGSITQVSEIPFLPIEFFKTHSIKTENWEAQAVYSSSGTTSGTTSRHSIRNVAYYLQNAKKGFETFYGDPSGFCFLALLPSYLERKGSSLVAMVRSFIELSKYSQSGFFLDDLPSLLRRIQYCQQHNIPTILIGVSFALLELAEQYPVDLSGIVVMETGGMKGRRRELTRPELHWELRKAFNLSQIHSEYGMTELLSQAYSKGNGLFLPSPTLKIFTREITDPFQVMPARKTGVINAIDLANLDSCSFIATGDLGKYYENGSFEVLGRLDGSDIRGCNLMVNEIRRV